MCDALRELMKDDLVQAERRGINIGIQIGIQIGVQIGILESLINVMSFFFVDAEKAMDVLLIPADEREIYRSLLP